MATVRMYVHELPKVETQPAPGYQRQWILCRNCQHVQFYDYIPYSLANPVLWCGKCGGSKDLFATIEVMEDQKPGKDVIDVLKEVKVTKFDTDVLKAGMRVHVTEINSCLEDDRLVDDDGFITFVEVGGQFIYVSLAVRSVSGERYDMTGNYTIRPSYVQDGDMILTLDTDKDTTPAPPAQLTNARAYPYDALLGELLRRPYDYVVRVSLEPEEKAKAEAAQRAFDNLNKAARKYIKENYGYTVEPT